MRVIAIDLDGCASNSPEQVNKLFADRSNLIIIYTARPEISRQATITELHNLGIKYHILAMGKVPADVYIDDRNAGGINWKIKE